MRIDLKAIADDLIRTVRGYVAASVHPISERLAVLETKYALAPPKGEKGEPGTRGEKGDPGTPGEKGERGEKGDDADPAPLRAEILKALFEAVEALPTPKDGERGADGERGPQGEKGEPGEKGERGPDGQPGERGEKGLDGADGLPGERGEVGPQGQPGISGGQGDSGPQGPVGEKGQKGDPGDRGENGRDGRDASDLDLIDEMIGKQLGARFEQLLGSLKIDSPDGGRTLVFEMLGIKHEVKTGHVLDRDFWKEGITYERGDGVTWSGSWWIAQVDKATERPGSGSQWRLAVKRGREGKEGKQGPQGPRGERGERVP